MNIFTAAEKSCQGPERAAGTAGEGWRIFLVEGCKPIKISKRDNKAISSHQTVSIPATGTYQKGGLGGTESSHRDSPKRGCWGTESSHRGSPIEGLGRYQIQPQGLINWAVRENTESSHRGSLIGGSGRTESSQGLTNRGLEGT